MSEFSECLSQILKVRNLNVAEAARQCSIDISVLFRWLSGSSRPKTWRRLWDVMGQLRLTSYESAELGTAYRREKLGELQSICFDEILKIFGTLADRRLSYRQGSQWQNLWSMPSADSRESRSGCRQLNGKMDIILCVQNVLSDLACSRGKGLSLKLHCLPEWLVIQLNQFRCNSGNPVDMFVCANSEEGKYRAVRLKLMRMRQMIDLLLLKNPIHIYFYYASGELCQMGQNCLVSDRFCIQFSSDLSHGMVTCDREWIAFFRENQIRLKEKAREFCICNRDLMGFLDQKSQLVRLKGASVGFMPCISVGLTECILRENIFPDLPDREEVISGILRYPDSVAQMRQFYSFFTKAGLHRFMDSGEVDLFEYEVYEPLSKTQRCEVLANIIDIRKNKQAIHYVLLKEEFADMQGICVEQRESEGNWLRVFFCFEGNENKEIFILDPDIGLEFERFFVNLRESSLVYSEEETLCVMEEVLEEYKQAEENRWVRKA